MKIIKEKLSLKELNQMAADRFGNMVKAVVDIDQELLAVDAELHSDLEALLLEEGSQQAGLWGINLYPGAGKEEFIEFDSMINMRPSQGNRSRGVESDEIRKKITAVGRGSSFYIGNTISFGSESIFKPETSERCHHCKKYGKRYSYLEYRSKLRRA